MEAVTLALLVAALFGAGFFCLLRRSLARVIIGLMLIGQGGNLVVFLSGGLTKQRPAFIEGGAKLPEAGLSDPLPQALVLTAIVIAFGLLAFVLALAQKAYAATKVDDMNRLEEGDDDE